MAFAFYVFPLCTENAQKRKSRPPAGGAAARRRVYETPVIRDVILRAAELITDRLPEAWTSELREKVSNGRRRADAVLSVEAPDGNRALVVIEAKRSTETRDAIPIAKQLNALSAGFGDDQVVATGLLAAPYVHPATRVRLTAFEARHEAAVVDHSPAEIAALEPGDRRSFTIEVAGPAALLVAKLHKLGDRDQDAPERLNDKDAHDVHRLLVAVATEDFARTLEMLLSDGLVSEATQVALDYMSELFVGGADAIGSQMAGRAEALLGDPATEGLPPAGRQRIGRPRGNPSSAARR